MQRGRIGVEGGRRERAFGKKEEKKDRLLTLTLAFPPIKDMRIKGPCSQQT